MDLVIWGIIFFFIIAFISNILKPSSCDICSAKFKKKYFTWIIDGKKQHLCPHCNSKMEKRNSDRHFKDRFG